MSVKLPADTQGVNGGKQTSEWRMPFGSRPSSMHKSSNLLQRSRVAAKSSSTVSIW